MPDLGNPAFRKFRIAEVEQLDNRELSPEVFERK